MNKVIIESNEFANWLDGYLKGVNTIANDAGTFSVNVLLMGVQGGNPAKSYMDFINQNDDFDELEIDFLPLRLTKQRSIEDWKSDISEKINSSFISVDSDLLHRVSYEVIDILCNFVSDFGLDKVLIYSAEMGENVGEYIFFCYRDDRYLVLGFMNEEKKLG